MNSIFVIQVYLSFAQVKRLNEAVISLQVEQDYLETFLQSLQKDQEELQVEIDKLQVADVASSHDVDEYTEE